MPLSTSRSRTSSHKRIKRSTSTRCSSSNYLRLQASTRLITRRRRRYYHRRINRRKSRRRTIKRTTLRVNSHNARRNIGDDSRRGQRVELRSSQGIQLSRRTSSSTSSRSRGNYRCSFLSTCFASPIATTSDMVRLSLLAYK